MKHCITAFLFFLNFSVFTYAQCPTGVAAFAASNPICIGSNSQLNISLLGPCSTYSVSSITFATVAGIGTNVTLGNDQVSSALPVGFTFNFFCMDYTQFYISSNGFITFSSSSSHGCCSGQLLPDASAPNNLIALAWEDFDPSAGGTINYFTTGTAPNRRLIVNFSNVPHTGAGGGALTSQLILYETTNVIEVHTTSQMSDGGLHTMGVEDASGTQGFAAAGRNAASWSTSGDGKRFSPGAIPPGPFTYAWSPTTGLSNPAISNPQASPSQNTTYTVTVIPSNTVCPTVSDTITVFVDTTTIAVSILTPDTGICAGSVAISTSSTGAASYLWSPSSGLSCTTCPNPIATPSVNTTYYITVFSAMSMCTAMDSISITVSNLAVYTASASDSTVCFGDSVQLSIIGNNFTENFDPINSPQWDSISGGAPNVNCGSMSGNALFFDGALQRSAATNALNVIGGGAVDFYLKIGNGTPASCETLDPGEDLVLEYSTNGGNTWNLMNTYLSGTYGTFTLASEPIPPAAQTVATMFRWRQLMHSGTCCDHWAIDNVLISISTPPSLTFNWAPSSGLACTTCANPMAAPSQTTTYTVTISDSICTATDTITIVVDTTNISVSILTPDTGICAGSVAISTSSTGAASYLWSPSSGLNCTTCPNPIATPSVSTTYYITVFSAISICTATDSISITVSNLAAYSASASDSTICIGDSVQLSMIGNNFIEKFDPINSPQWDSISGGAPNVNCGSVSGDALFFDGALQRSAATNALNVIGGGTVGFYLKIGNGTPASCETLDPGEDLVLEYSTNGGNTWNLMNTYLSGTYGTFTLASEPIPPAAQTAATMFRWRQLTHSGTCCDHWALDDILISISSPASLTFNWAPSTGLACTTCANPMAAPSQTTTYTVTISDSICTATDTITIFVDTNTVSVSVLTADTFICVGDSVPITISSSGAGSYLWSPAVGLTCTTCPNPIASPFFTTTYYVTAFAPFGACSSMDSITVNVSSLTQITPTASPNPACGAGDSVQLSVAISGNPPSGYCTPTYSILCSSGDFVDNFSFNTLVNNGTGCNGNPNNYIYYPSMSTTVIPGNSYNLSMQSGLTWNQGFGVWIDYNIDGDFNDPTEFIYASPTSATTVFNAVITVPLTAMPGATRLRVACSYANTVTAGQSCFPTFSYGECEDYNVLVSGPQSNFVYSWSPAANLSNATIANPIATPTVTSTYSVTVTDTLVGCSLSGVITVTVNPLPTANVSPSSATVCSGQIVTLTASGGNSYSWQPGGQTTAVVNVVIGNNYSVTVTDQYGCTDIATASVTVNPSPFVTVSGATTICSGQSATLTASGGTSFSWSPGGQTTTSIVVSPSATTTYTAVGTNSFGCSNSSSATVTVILPAVASFTYTAAGSTVTFTSTSQNATSWNWNFGDAGTSTLQNPVHTYTAGGTYTVTLIASNSCGPDTVSMVITITGIWEHSDNSSLSVYPNPASKTVTVSIKRQFFEEGYLNIINMLGEVIVSQKISKPSTGFAEFKIDVSHIPSGVYMIKLHLDDIVLMQELVINQ